MTWPEAFFYSVLAVCGLFALILIAAILLLVASAIVVWWEGRK